MSEPDAVERIEPWMRCFLHALFAHYYDDYHELDDAIRRWLPELAQHAPAAGKRIEGDRLAELRTLYIQADSELSAIAYGRAPSSKDELLKISGAFRRMVEQLDEELTEERSEGHLRMLSVENDELRNELSRDSLGHFKARRDAEAECDRLRTKLAAAEATAALVDWCDEVHHDDVCIYKRCDGHGWDVLCHGVCVSVSHPTPLAAYQAWLATQETGDG